MEILSNFVVLEGGDGCGTTTQAGLLTERMKTFQKPVLYSTFEPTNGKIGSIVRAALKNEIPLKPETLCMLFAADRNEHLHGAGGIIEYTQKGYLVVSDRYVLSSLVYQGIECGDDLPLFLNGRFPAPELTIFLEIKPEIALERAKSRSSLEIYEHLDFQKKVHEKYHSAIEVYRNSGARVEIIDASKSANEIAENIWKVLCRHLRILTTED
ncbi:MAG: dTMP kinase [Treponema sp.]|jgi:dTMP kinase|nr:dTMP kinase [Treponema sp.]